MSPRQGPALRIAGIAISLIGLAAVVWWASRQEAPRLPDGGSEWTALAASLLAYALATTLRGERTQHLLTYAGAEPARSDSYALTAVNQMGNNVLPARGGDLIRLVLQAPRARTRTRTALGVLVAERALDAATLLSLFVVLGFVLLRGIDTPGGGEGWWIALIAAAGLALAAALLYALRDHARIRALRGWLDPVTTVLRGLGSRHGIEMGALTLAIWLSEAACWYAAAASVGLGMDPLEALYLLALASIFVLIPSGPGYLGTLDAAVLFGAEAIGAAGSEAVSFLIMLRFVLLFPITLAGLALLIGRYGGFRSARRPYPEPDA